MPASTVSLFSELEDFQAAMEGEAHVSLFVTKGDRFYASLIRVKLPHLRLIDVEESVPRVALLNVPQDSLLVVLPPNETGTAVWGGMPLRPNEICLVRPGQVLPVRTRGRCHWSAIWLPLSIFTEYGRALSSTPPRVDNGMVLWLLPLNAVQQLRRHHAAAVRAAKKLLQPVTHVLAGHGLEQQIIHAIFDGLQSGMQRRLPASLPQEWSLAAQIDACLDPFGPRMRLPSLSAKLGTPPAIVRQTCSSQFGMGSSGYELVRRLHAARRMLRTASDARGRVRTTALHLGFSDRGSFARSYRQLFGETPSRTLRQSSPGFDPSSRRRASGGAFRPKRLHPP